MYFFSTVLSVIYSIFALIFIDKFISSIQKFCVFSKYLVYSLIARICKQLFLAYFWFFSLVYAHILYPHSLCLAFLSKLNGPSFQILHSFLYDLPLLLQFFYCFILNDPLALSVCWRCLLSYLRYRSNDVIVRASAVV